MGVLRQQAATQQRFTKCATTDDIRVQLHANEETATTDIDDSRMVERLQAVQQVVAQCLGAFGKLLALRQLHGHQPHRRRQRIAAKRAAMIARREHGHHVRPCDERRHRQQPSRPAPCQASRVRGRMPSCSYAKLRPVRPMPGLHLVTDEQNIVTRTDFADTAQIAGRRQHDAGFTLNRLDQERGRVRRDGALQSIAVANGMLTKPGVNGPKPSRYWSSDELMTVVVRRRNCPRPR